VTRKSALTVAATLLESDEWKFKTKLSNDVLTVVGVTDDDYDYSGSLDVYWEVIFELREWGIKGMDVQINQVKLRLAQESVHTLNTTNIVVDWPNATPRPEGTFEEPTLDFALHMAEVPWTVTYQLNFADRASQGISVSPTRATVDLNEHTIEIEF
jgi:hypothetical protein